MTAPQRFFAFRNVSAMAYLRRHRPILRIGSAVVVVARREDVMAVLEDDRSFPTPYTDGLASGFVLGLTGPDANRHRAALDDVLRFSDRAGLEQHAAALAQECVDNAGPGRMAVGQRAGPAGPHRNRRPLPRYHRAELGRLHGVVPSDLPGHLPEQRRSAHRPRPRPSRGRGTGRVSCGRRSRPDGR